MSKACEKGRKRNLKNSDILFTLVISKHYENVIMTLLGYKATKSQIHTEKIYRNKIE